MKKVLLILLSSLLIFSASACSNNPTSSADTPEWKSFVAEYEEWVDDYIIVVKKYKENPADLTILSDYTEMVKDMADWSEKIDDIEDELTSSEAIEFAAEVSRIAAKLATVAN